MIGSEEVVAVAVVLSVESVVATLVVSVDVGTVVVVTIVKWILWQNLLKFQQ